MVPKIGRSQQTLGDEALSPNPLLVGQVRDGMRSERVRVHLDEKGLFDRIYDQESARVVTCLPLSLVSCRCVVVPLLFVCWICDTLFRHA